MPNKDKKDTINERNLEKIQVFARNYGKKSYLDQLVDEKRAIDAKVERLRAPINPCIGETLGKIKAKSLKNWEKNAEKPAKKPTRSKMAEGYATQKSMEKQKVTDPNAAFRKEKRGNKDTSIVDDTFSIFHDALDALDEVPFDDPPDGYDTWEDWFDDQNPEGN